MRQQNKRAIVSRRAYKKSSLKEQQLCKSEGLGPSTQCHGPEENGQSHIDHRVQTGSTCMTPGCSSVHKLDRSGA